MIYGHRETTLLSLHRMVMGFSHETISSIRVSLVTAIVAGLADTFQDFGTYFFYEQYA